VLTCLQAVLTVAAFTPRLTALGREAPAPRWLTDGSSPLTAALFASDAWLVHVAVLTALVGAGGAVVVGQKLVALEVGNQVVEAALRKRLVLAEDDTPLPRRPSDGAGHAAHASEGSAGCGALDVACTRGGASSCGGALASSSSDLRSPAAYTPLVSSLSSNYARLFASFFGFNMWVGGWKQLVVMVPLVLIGPRLFDLEQPIPLGVLTQVPYPWHLSVT
jgi:ABC-type long-subunit fatty acid transport system fused permease/ATPase subunit